jgi:steroid delta-isomerase-like uncharacterized protein
MVPMIAEKLDLTATDIVQELIEAWNTHDVERALSFFSQTCEGTDIAETRTYSGKESLRKLFQRYQSAFPDSMMTCKQLMVQESRVMVHWGIAGTHRHTLMNIPPTEKFVNFYGITVFTFEGNEIVRSVCLWDVAGLLCSLGLLPELQE